MVFKKNGLVLLLAICCARGYSILAKSNSLIFISLVSSWEGRGNVPGVHIPGVPFPSAFLPGLSLFSGNCRLTDLVVLKEVLRSGCAVGVLGLLSEIFNLDISPLRSLQEN